MEKVVFLDRDGTINEEIGYLHRIEDCEFVPRAGEAIRLLNEHHYKVFVITNQAGVAKGLYQEENVHILHQYMQEKLNEMGAFIDGFYYCPYHPDGIVEQYKRQSDCRKPGIGLIKEVEKTMEIDKANSWMVGDMGSDMQTGRNYGIKTILVSTGHGMETYEKQNCPYDYYVKDIYEAVLLLIRQ